MSENKTGKDNVDEELTGSEYFLAKRNQAKMLTQKIVAREHKANIALMLGVLFGVMLPQIAIIVGSFITKTGSEYILQVIQNVSETVATDFGVIVYTVSLLFILYSAVFTTLVFLIAKTVRRRAAWGLFIFITGPLFVALINYYLANLS